MRTNELNLTGANRENRERRLNLRFLCSLLLKFARDTVPPYVDNPESFRDKPELREYKAVFVIGDQEVSQFSDEITVNCAPLV